MDLDAQRKAAGEQAAQLVQDGMVIGYGTGRAATAALEALARRKVRVRGVPTSQKTVQICQRLGLSLVALEDHPRLDLVIDGADEVDPRAPLIKGGGGARRRPPHHRRRGDEAGRAPRCDPRHSHRGPRLRLDRDPPADRGVDARSGAPGRPFERQRRRARGCAAAGRGRPARGRPGAQGDRRARGARALSRFRTDGDRRRTVRSPRVQRWLTYPAPEIAFWMRAGFAEASSNTTVMVFASRSDETRTTPLTFCTADSVL